MSKGNKSKGTRVERPITKSLNEDHLPVDFPVLLDDSDAESTEYMNDEIHTMTSNIKWTYDSDVDSDGSTDIENELTLPTWSLHDSTDDNFIKCMKTVKNDGKPSDGKPSGGKQSFVKTINKKS